MIYDPIVSPKDAMCTQQYMRNPASYCGSGHFGKRTQIMSETYLYPGIAYYSS